MDDTVVSTAALVFTASTVLMGLCLGLLGSIWRIVHKTLEKLPVEDRRIAVNRNGIENPKTRHIVGALQVLSVGCALLAVGILLDLVAMGGVTATMVGIHGGPFQESNFNQSRYFLLAAVITFTAAVVPIAGILVGDAIDTVLGKERVLG